MSGGKKIPMQEITLIPLVAAQLALGRSTTEIAQNLNIGFNTAKRIAAKEETKAVVKEIADGYKEVAQAMVMKNIADMTELALEGLKKALKDGNVQAVRTHFQVLGVLGEEGQNAKGDKGAGSLTIVMPGAAVTQNEVIDVSGQEVAMGFGEEGSQDSSER